MTASTLPSGRWAHVAWARTQQRLGWPGLAGITLIVTALAVFIHAGFVRAGSPELDLPAGSQALTPAQPPAAAASTVQAPLTRLPRRSELPLLLTQIEQIALRNELGWRAADYRLTPDSPQEPSRLEVRCSLKGPYPALRRLLTQVLQTVPGAGLRELTLSRASSDSAEVEAKLTLAIWLQDTAPGRSPMMRPLETTR